MPFKLGAITASNAEEFQKCREYLDVLNGMIQTLNGKEVAVNVTTGMFQSGIVVTPCHETVKELRVMAVLPDGSPTGVSWVDVRGESVWVVTANASFKISLIPAPSSA